MFESLTTVELVTALGCFFIPVLIIVALQVALLLRKRPPIASPELLQATEARIAQRFIELQTLNEATSSSQRQELQSVLRTRFTESFQIVDSRLREVRQGLEDVHNLSQGVERFNRLMSNVKKRGIWGETQLEALLQQTLTPSQFAPQCKVNPRRNEFVDFALLLPGAGEKPVYLPIDAKFPMEDYERLVDAAGRNDATAVNSAAEQLMERIKLEARSIHDKYISPPYTTDFAVMFLPIEGLYQEAISHTAEIEELHQKYHVLVAGPMSLCALLNALRMGFRTLAVQKNSLEVWRILAKVQKDIESFADDLDKITANLTKTMSGAESAIKRLDLLKKKLDKVETMEGRDDAKSLD